MTKQEFLIQLQRALNGKVSPDRIQEHVRYYDDYISMQMRKGKTEEETLGELGDPRLLARTIAAADPGGAETQNPGEGTESVKRSGILRIPGWLAALAVILLLAAVLYAAGALLSIVLPVLLPVLLVLFLIRWLRKK